MDDYPSLPNSYELERRLKAYVARRLKTTIRGIKSPDRMLITYTLVTDFGWTQRQCARVLHYSKSQASRDFDFIRFWLFRSYNLSKRREILKQYLLKKPRGRY